MKNTSIRKSMKLKYSGIGKNPAAVRTYYLKTPSTYSKASILELSTSKTAMQDAVKPNNFWG
jgi:hypothetical protein